MIELDLKYTYDNKFKHHKGENKNDFALNLDLSSLLGYSKDRESNDPNYYNGHNKQSLKTKYRDN